MKFLMTIMTMFFMFSAMAIQAPFQPWSEDLINQKIIKMDSGKILVGNSSGKSESFTLSGDMTISNAGVATLGSSAVDSLSNGKKTARATYDVAVDLGTVAAHGLGITLPANAIITKSWFYVVTATTSTGGNGTLAFHCETANNILTAADLDANAAGAIVAGIQLDAVATHDGTGAAGILGAACELTATVAVEALLTGKYILFVEYVIAE